MATQQEQFVTDFIAEIEELIKEVPLSVQEQPRLILNEIITTNKISRTQIEYFKDLRRQQCER